MRKKIVAGNWKMNKTTAEARELAAAVKQSLAQSQDVDVVLCPPCTALQAVGAVIAGSRIALGGQNMFWEKSGAYTGEISPDMLVELQCRYVILGHSERRQYFNETDDGVNRKAKAALAAGLRPIVCVGETLAQRQGNQTKDVVGTQVRASLAGLGEAGWRETVVAYEPVWAIGTGMTASPEQAQEVHEYIRQLLTEMAGAAVAQGMRLQYGGSVKAANARELFQKPDIDGGLIGGAALDAKSFIAIVEGAR